MKQNTRDVSSEHFWNENYIQNNIGWDLDGPTPVFKDWCGRLNKKFSIFVPGAGNGYDPLYFSKKGHQVLAVDFAEEAVRSMKNQSKKENLNVDILKCDLFDLDIKYNNKFDYVVEYTCFCAIDPKNRKNYINVMSELLKDKGELIGLFFPLNKTKEEGGPPFSVDLEETISFFSEKFNLKNLFDHPLSIKPRLGNEKFLHFKKK